MYRDCSDFPPIQPSLSVWISYQLIYMCDSNIHSIMLDVHVGRQNAQNVPFIPLQCKLDKNHMLSPLP